MNPEAALPPGISVVVPVYNSEGSLAILVGQLSAVLAELGRPFEIILVNDGSRDASWKVASGLASGSERVRAFDLMRNFGQHNALLCGVRAARYDTVVTMDDDLQHPPEEVPALLAKLDEGYGVVYGYPLAERHGFLRDCASVVTKRVLERAMGVRAARHMSAFRAFRTRLRGAFERFSRPTLSLDVLLSWGTADFAAVPVDHRPRPIGKSNYTFSRLVAHAINTITGFTTVPLRVAVFTGFSIVVLGTLMLTYVVVRYFASEGGVPGFAFLASSIAIFSGVQLFALGVIGEYVARLFEFSIDRPTYVVRTRVVPAEGARDPDPAPQAIPRGGT